MSLQGPTRGRRSSGNCTGFEGLLCPRGVPLPSGLVFKFSLPPRGTHLGGETDKGSPIPYPTCCSSVTHRVQLFVTPWTAAHQASLSFTISLSLFKLTSSIESVMPFNHLLLCRLLLLLPSVFPSIRIFSNESVLHIRWPKYWSFNFSVSPSNEYSGLISFTIDWFDLLAGQGTLKNLLQHHSLVRRTLLQEDSLHPAWGTGSLHIKSTH